MVNDDESVFGVVPEWTYPGDQVHGLWWLFHRKHWSDEFREMPEQFYCVRCHMVGGEKVRPVHIGASDRQFQMALPIPDDREWKRALRRFRC